LVWHRGCDWASLSACDGEKEVEARAPVEVSTLKLVRLAWDDIGFGGRGPGCIGSGGRGLEGMPPPKKSKRRLFAAGA
jgi:hypothetical protein